MLSRSKIPWLVNADGSPGYTWSPTSGCGPGLPCYDRCWARAYHVRYRKGDFSVKLHPEQLDAPLRLRKPSVIGVCLMGDLFHDDVPDEFIRQVFIRVAHSPHLFVVLTKRPERYAQWFAWVDDYPNGMRPKLLEVCAGQPWPLRNVWLGVSVEDQATADSRIPILLDTPAAHRWVSYEPALGPVDLLGWLRTFYAGDWDAPPGTIRSGARQKKIDLVIQGCESGPRRRPFDVQWARDVRDQCKAAGVAYYLKQMPFETEVDGGPYSSDKIPGSKIVIHPLLDGRQHLDLPWSHQAEGGT